MKIKAEKIAIIITSLLVVGVVVFWGVMLTSKSKEVKHEGIYAEALDLIKQIRDNTKSDIQVIENMDGEEGTYFVTDGQDSIEDTHINSILNSAQAAVIGIEDDYNDNCNILISDGELYIRWEIQPGHYTSTQSNSLEEYTITYDPNTYKMKECNRFVGSSWVVDHYFGYWEYSIKILSLDEKLDNEETFDNEEETLDEEEHTVESSEANTEEDAKTDSLILSEADKKEVTDLIEKLIDNTFINVKVLEDFNDTDHTETIFYNNGDIYEKSYYKGETREEWLSIEDNIGYTKTVRDTIKKNVTPYDLEYYRYNQLYGELKYILMLLDTTQIRSLELQEDKIVCIAEYIEQSSREPAKSIIEINFNSETYVIKDCTSDLHIENQLDNHYVMTVQPIDENEVMEIPTEVIENAHEEEYKGHTVEGFT